MAATPGASDLGGGRSGPSVAAITFVLWALAIPLVFADRLLNTDGDLASHIFLGRRVLEHGVVVPVNWAFTVRDGVFVAYEWLAEVLLAGVESVLGLAGIVALATALIAGSVALAAAYLTRRVEPLWALPLAMAVAVLTAAHWSARPHLFSLVGLAALLCVGTSRWRWRAPAVGLLFALWANLHPGFLYGLAVYAAYLAGDAIDRRDRGASRSNALAGIAAAAGTLVNPLGWELHAAILHHLADRRAFAMVDEFLPPSPATVHGALFLASLALLLALVVRARRPPPWRGSLPLALAVAAALVAARNVPLYAVFAFPLAARPLLAAAADAPRSFAPELRARLVADEARATTRRWVGGAAAALALAAAVSARTEVRLLPDAFSPAAFPVEAVSAARAAGLTGTRIFHEYTWGGYLLYAWPGQPIYIDGMANLFGSDLMEEYRALYEAAPGWERTLEGRQIGAVLVSPASPLAAAIRRSAGAWTVAHESDVAVLFTRRGA